MTYQETIFDVATGKETIRPYTKEEIANAEAKKVQIEAEIFERQTIEAAKEAAKQAVLSKLGLTAEEVAALLA